MSDKEVSTNKVAEEEIVVDAADNTPVTEDTPAPAETAEEGAGATADAEKDAVAADAEDAGATADAMEDVGAADAKEDAGAADTKPKKKKRTAKPKVIEVPKILKKSGHPTFTDMIIYAIESLGERKGSSVQAIRSFIIKTYPTVKQEKIKALLKNALIACVDAGTIKRPAGQEDTKTLTGRYKVVKDPLSNNPTCEEMVVAAVGALDEKKGATAMAIKAYITDNYDHVRPEMIRHQVRLGLKKAMAKGSVAPHKSSSDGKVSLLDRWHIKGAAKKEILKEKKKEREAEAAKEAAKKAAAAREAKKKAASKKAAPKKPASKKAAPKKVAPKKPVVKKVVKRAPPKRRH